jgi:hypothetical protein
MDEFLDISTMPLAISQKTSARRHRKRGYNARLATSQPMLNGRERIDSKSLYCILLLQHQAQLRAFPSEAYPTWPTVTQPAYRLQDETKIINSAALLS